MNVLDEVMNRLTLSEGGTLSVRTCAHATGGETEEGHRMEGQVLLNAAMLRLLH